MTIKDVARLAGVSISTVSRVINDSKPVSPEVRMKVLKIIKETGYKPNDIARTLVTKKSYLIGVIVTDLANSYIAEMVRGIEEVGKMYNYDILLCSSYGDKTTELKYMQLLNRKQVEGIILISDDLDEAVETQLKEYRIPFMFLSKNFIQEQHPTVTIDNFNATYEMTNYLLSLGHRNIAYVTKQGNQNILENLKLDGYRKAINESDSSSETIFYAKNSEIEGGYEITEDIFKSGSDITAVFYCNDEMAIGAINYCYDNSIKVPEDISVAGYGDTNIASILRPKLTTIKVPFYDMGAVAIRKIIKELKGEKTDDFQINLPFHIEKRDSSMKLK